MTLELTVKPGPVLLLRTRDFIRGNIDHVIEILGKTMHRTNVLVDLADFRSHTEGRYEFVSKDGLFDHNQVRDIMNEQSGLMMLCPGEVISFAFAEQYVHIFNTPRIAANAYLQFIVSSQALRPQLSKHLESIRRQSIKAIPVGGEEWSPSQDAVTANN